MCRFGAFGQPLHCCVVGSLTDRAQYGMLQAGGTLLGSPGLTPRAHRAKNQSFLGSQGKVVQSSITDFLFLTVFKKTKGFLSDYVQGERGFPSLELLCGDVIWPGGKRHTGPDGSEAAAAATGGQGRGWPWDPPKHFLFVSIWFCYDSFNPAPS